MSLTLSNADAPAPAEATPIYYGILTDQGQALLASAIASGLPLPLTQMAVGDGAGQSVTPQPEMTALVNEVYRAPLNQLFVDPTAANQIVAEMVMGEAIGGFWIRELGLYDESGTLFAVANAPASYKPILDEGAGRALLTRMVLIVSDTSAVELILNPDMVMASKAYVDAKIAEHAASRDHPAAIEGAQGMIPLATQAMVDEGTDHTSALTPKTAGEAFARQQHEHEMDDILWLQEALDEKLPMASYLPRTDSLNNQQGEVEDIRNKDMNTCKAGEFGLYEKATCANSPPNAGAFYYCETKSTYAAMETIQFAFGYDRSQGVMAWRSLMTAATPQAGPWREVFDTDNPPSSSDIAGLDEVLDEKLNKAGDTATGNLTAPKFIMNAAQGTGPGDAVRYDFLDTQIPKRPGLCQSNLNSHTSAGIFHQSSDTTAANGQNYPAPYQGTLLVFANGGGSLQIYSTWSTMGWQFRRIYYRTQFQGSFSSWLEVYDTGNPPTPDEIGAAPLSHTHTAAQGNQDIVAGGHSQVGTYALGLWGGGGGNRAAGAMLSGGQLNFSTCEGELTGGNMAGTWKLLGALVGEGDYGVWNTSLFIRVA